MQLKWSEQMSHKNIIMKMANLKNSAKILAYIFIPAIFSDLIFKLIMHHNKAYNNTQDKRQSFWALSKERCQESLSESFYKILIAIKNSSNLV